MLLGGVYSRGLPMGPFDSGGGSMDPPWNSTMEPSLCQGALQGGLWPRHGSCKSLLLTSAEEEVGRRQQLALPVVLSDCLSFPTACGILDDGVHGVAAPWFSEPSAKEANAWQSARFVIPACRRTSPSRRTHEAACHVVPRLQLRSGCIACTLARRPLCWEPQRSGYEGHTAERLDQCVFTIHRS